MKNSTKKLLPLYIKSALSVAVVMPTIANAAIEEVVVTARKRMETVQETPITVTAFTADDLQKTGMTTFTALSTNNPNVRIGTGTSGGPTIATTVAIRGNIQNDQLAQLDASVGVYVDGLVFSHTIAMDGAFLDVESVQTLKGPQGTLFGRNTTGGALLVETKNPELGNLGGSVKAGASSYGGREYVGIANLPLNDSMALRLAAQRKSMDAYVTYDDGQERGDRLNKNYRGKFLWDISEATSLLIAAQRDEVSGTAPVNYMTQPNHPQYNNVPARIPLTIGGVPIGISVPLLADPGHDFNEATAKTYALTLTHDLGWAELKFFAGRRDVNISKTQSLPPFSGFSSLDWPKDRQDSYELQMNGTALSDDLQYTAGLYYFKQDTTQDEKTVNILETLQDISAKSKSVFGQATYALLDDLNITLGGRYTKDERNVKGTLSGLPPSTILETDLSKNKFNYLVSADYKITSDVMVYASTSTGYRSGSAASAIDSNDATKYRALDPEEVTNYEVGAKSDWFGGALRINGALYKQKYDNYQYTGIRGIGLNLQRQVFNIDADISGGELEVTALLPSDIRINATYGYTDAHETSTSAKHSLPNIPQTTYGLSIGKDTEIFGGTLNTTASYSWQDQIFSSLDSPGPSTTDAYGLLNLSASYNIDHWTVAAYVNNATNEKYYTGSVYFDNPGYSDAVLTSQAGFPISGIQQPGLSFATPGLPRVIGASVQYEF